MKPAVFKGSILFFLIIILSLALTNINTFAQERTGKYTIVIHGGAGTISKNLPDSVKKAYTDALAHALTVGKDILAKGGKSIDAVEAVIQYFETDPKFNAGIGGLYFRRQTRVGCVCNGRAGSQHRSCSRGEEYCSSD